MTMSTINFDKLHDKLNDKPRTYFVNSLQLISSVLNDAVECMDSLPLNGGVRPAYAIIEVDRKGQITIWNVFNDLEFARQVMESIRKDEKPKGKLEIARNEWIEEWEL